MCSTSNYLKVLSIDIGTVNYVACAIEFSNSRDEVKNVAQCSLVNILGSNYSYVKLVDIFSVNMGQGKKTTTAIDTLILLWPDLLLLQCWTPDVVLIESQYKGAPTNLALAYSTYTLCRRSFPHANIRFVAPMNKFFGYKSFFPDLQHDSLNLRTYSQRKQTAVCLTSRILEQYFGTSINDIYRSEGLPNRTTTKIDDACDAFLQTFCVV